MKNEKGITLISLVVTIIILLILAGVATSSGVEAIRNSKYTKFTTELKIMQSYVNNWYEELVPTGLTGDAYDTQFTTNITSKFANAPVSATNANSDAQAKVALDAISDANYTDYYVLDGDVLAALHIEGVEQTVLVNVKKRKVVSYEGFKNKAGDMVYTLSNNEIYNVEYEKEKAEEYQQ